MPGTVTDPEVNITPDYPTDSVNHHHHRLTTLPLVLGPSEDVCNGGYLTVAASTNAREVTLLGEKFDEGHADLEYRWIDRLAGIEGAEIDVRSLSLTKVKKEGHASSGSILVPSCAIFRSPIAS